MCERNKKREEAVINDIKPYPAYKNTLLPWLCKLPTSWKLLRGKALFRTIDVRSDSGNEELLTVSSAHGVVKRQQASVTMFKAESYAGYKLCWPGDLVINSLWAWAGGLGFSPFHGIVSTAYSVFRLKHNNKWSQIFFHYLVRSSPFQWELQTRSKGVWISRLQITDESFLDISFPLPSLSEQRAIAKFLDWADRRIRLIIAARKRRIQLLEEYRQTLIDDAVTGKFDVRTGKPYPAYKDSGEEWLGKVPEEWEVKQLKRVTRLNPSKTEVPRALRTGLATFLPMERVGNDGTFDASEIRPVKDLWNGFTYFRKGDVIVAKITPSFENGKGLCWKLFRQLSVSDQPNSTFSVPPSLSFPNIYTCLQSIRSSAASVPTT